MSGKTWCGTVGLMILVASHFHHVQASSHEYYKGKTVRIVVGMPAGSAFDIYARTLARHMGRHVPGGPTFIVENMAGAGSLVAANHVYGVAKPDGLTIGSFLTGLFLGQVLGQPGIQFDAAKFEYIGSPDRQHPVCAFSKASGITSVEKWRAAKAPAVGATGPGATTYNVPSILKATLDLPVQLISGYKGPGEILRAITGGELAGVCNVYQSLKVTSAEDIQAGNLVIVVQVMPQAHRELPEVSLAIDFAKTDAARQVIEAGIHGISTISRPYVLPPGTPKERVQMLRKAFADTMKDREFLADATKSKLDLDPLTGEELEKTVNRLIGTDPATLAMLKDILK